MPIYVVAKGSLVISMAKLKTPTTNQQTERSQESNASFFLDEIEGYGERVGNLDTYQYIRDSINEAIAGSESLVDIGNGGVFDYDTTLVKQILAVDLFLESLPESYIRPVNVTFANGDALNLGASTASRDAVLIVMVLHHLIGRTVEESLKNIEQCIREAWRVLSPGGRLVIVESCVPRWFYQFECAIFPLATAVINRVSAHPPTLQFTPEIISELLSRATGCNAESQPIRQGRWVLQYGKKWPSALTPIRPYRFQVQRPPI